MQGKAEILMGHMRECLTHYLTTILKGKPKGTEEAVAAKGPIAEFCGVIVPTVTTWVANEELCPRGETLIKVMCFLDLLGYRLIQFESMPKLFRNFLELIGFGVITTKEAAELLEFKSIAAESEIYRILVRKDHNVEHGTSERRKQLMFEIWKQKKDELEQKKAQAEAKYYFDFAVIAEVSSAFLASSSAPHLAGASTALEGSVNSHSSQVRYLPSLQVMAALLTLLEEGSGTELSNGDVSQLSKQDVQLILKLSARMSVLSSKVISQNQQKEV